MIDDDDDENDDDDKSSFELMLWHLCMFLLFWNSFSKL